VEGVRVVSEKEHEKVLSLLALLVQKYEYWLKEALPDASGGGGANPRVLSLLALLVQKYEY
jgi:hypothetical protein